VPIVPESSVKTWIQTNANETYPVSHTVTDSESSFLFLCISRLPTKAKLLFNGSPILNNGDCVFQISFTIIYSMWSDIFPNRWSSARL